jgi:putative PIN family toxin of toxin-antitoxin system
MTKLRLVLDTNILISALLSKKSIPFKVVDFAFNYHVLLASDETLAEIKRVLNREKFDKYLSKEERYIFLAKFMTTAEKVSIIKRFNACRDLKDNCFLDLAVSGKANFLISGDEDLLVLNPFEDIPIIMAHVFACDFIEI